MNYKPLTDTYIDSFDDLSDEDIDGYLGDSWSMIREQLKRANVLAEAVRLWTRTPPEELPSSGDGPATAAYAERALAAYLGEVGNEG